MHVAAEDLGEVVIDSEKDIKAQVLRFASGWCIHCVSSNPDALVGKTGHVKLDEFAVSKLQRELFRYAKPCTTWGGQIAIISTHRGIDTVFNEMLVSIKQKGNPMGFSHHRVTLHDAVEQGLVEKINEVRGLKNPSSTNPSIHSSDLGESRDQFLARLRAECLDEESWLQEYCCIPADENSAFITYEIIHSCESPGCLKSFSYLESSCDSDLSPSHDLADSRSFYLGVDVARKHHLTVIDVGEKIGDVHWDRMRIELHDKTFSEIEHELYKFLELPRSNVAASMPPAWGCNSPNAQRNASAGKSKASASIQPSRKKWRSPCAPPSKIARSASTQIQNSAPTSVASKSLSRQPPLPL